MNHIKRFEEYLGDRSKLTKSSYLSDVKQFMDFIGVPADRINNLHGEKYKAHLQEQGFKVVTINRKIVSLKKFVEYLNDNGHKIIMTVKPDKQQKQEYLDEMLDKKDFEAMVDAAVSRKDTRAKAIFYTLLYTGARVSEMIQLKVGQVEDECITIKGKGSKYRDIFIPARLRTVWVEYLPDRSERTDMLFTGQRGPINRHTVHYIIKKYAELAGVSEKKAHAHNFRHLYCKMLVDRGHSIDSVADLAGHSDINTTRIYTRKTRRELLSAINDL